MKVAINSDFGGFGLSPKAIKRLADLQGRECHFVIPNWTFLCDLPDTPCTLEEAEEAYHFTARDVPDLGALIPMDIHWAELPAGERERYKTLYSQHTIEAPDDRSDPLLVQVIEELEEKSDGQYSSLKIVEIPDGIKFEIDSIQGRESIYEVGHWWY